MATIAKNFGFGQNVISEINKRLKVRIYSGAEWIIPEEETGIKHAHSWD